MRSLEDTLRRKRGSGGGSLTFVIACSQIGLKTALTTVKRQPHSRRLGNPLAMFAPTNLNRLVHSPAKSTNAMLLIIYKSVESA